MIIIDNDVKLFLCRFLGQDTSFAAAMAFLRVVSFDTSGMKRKTSYE